METISIIKSSASEQRQYSRLTNYFVHAFNGSNLDAIKEIGEIYVVTGPVLKGNMNSIGHNDVAVPNFYYKVILDNNENNPKAIGFIMRNEGSKASLSTYAVSIDSVESFTGLDFFPSLSDKIEQRVEHSFCISCWNWNVHKQTRNTTSTNSVAIQCSGITKKGLRCKRMTKDPSGKCWQHD